MDRVIIKHYLDELPREILESAYNIDIFTTQKRFTTHLDFDRDIYEKYKKEIRKYKEKACRPDDDEGSEGFIEFEIGSWKVIMEKEEE